MKIAWDTKSNELNVLFGQSHPRRGGVQTTTRREKGRVCWTIIGLLVSSSQPFPVDARGFHCSKTTEENAYRIREKDVLCSMISRSARWRCDPYQLLIDEQGGCCHCWNGVDGFNRNGATDSMGLTLPNPVLVNANGSGQSIHLAMELFISISHVKCNPTQTHNSRQTFSQSTSTNRKNQNDDDGIWNDGI